MAIMLKDLIKNLCKISESHAIYIHLPKGTNTDKIAFELDEFNAFYFISNNIIYIETGWAKR